METWNKKLKTFLFDKLLMNILDFSDTFRNYKARLKILFENCTLLQSKRKERTMDSFQYSKQNRMFIKFCFLTMMNH